MTTQQGYEYVVTVAGRVLGVYDTFSGGKASGEPTKRRSGGGRRMKQYAVLSDFDDVTVTKVYEKNDHDVVTWLMTQAAGKAPMSVAEVPIDIDGVRWGKPRTYSGTLMSADPGEADMTSTDNRMLELVMQTVDVK